MPRKPSVKRPLITPTTDRVVPDVQHGMIDAAHYRGNVPLSSFLGWVALVILGALAVGVLLSQGLITQRQNQLIDDTAARVALQGQARAKVVGEWVYGMEKVADATASAQLVRLYVAEMGQKSPPADAELSAALRAQTPYMQQVLKDFAKRHGAESVILAAADGNVLASVGPIPAELPANPARLTDMAHQQKGTVLPLRLSAAGVVMDIVRPIFQPTQEGVEAPMVGVLWITLPVGESLSQLVASTPLDRIGERTAIVQKQGHQAVVVGRDALAPVGDESELAADGHAMRLSVVDGHKTFAAVHAISGTPLAILQEFRAADALAAMRLYKPGLYTITLLAVGVLGALMLALTLHLMSQRNSTRVKLLGQTMDALVRMVEARDPHLAGHHGRLSRLVVKVANRMNYGVGERATLFYAAQLSAVGRLLVPRDLTNKSGKLTPAERAAMEQHVAQAQDIMGDLPFDLPVVPVIRQMYERMDGSGYPSGLAGQAIHPMARLLGAADAYLALTSKRSYRAAMTPDEALAVMEKSGQFDMAIVRELVRE